MKLATTTGDFGRYAKDDAAAVAAFEKTGFRHLDYSFYNVIYKNSPFLSEKWKKEVSAAAETAARLGFDFVQAHSPSYNPLNENCDHEAGMKATINTIEACGMLGIKNIVVHPGFTEKYTYPDGRNDFFRENKKFFEKLLPTAEKYNVTLCAENSAEANMGICYFLMTGQEMAAFAQYVDHPLIKCCFDVGHANMRDTSIYKDITDIGEHLKALHIQDNYGTYDEHMAPFFGTLDLDAVMQALLKIDFKGYFTFEADNMLGNSQWPHSMKADSKITERKLERPTLELKIEAERLLFNIGKHILTSYDCFEE